MYYGCFFDAVVQKSEDKYVYEQKEKAAVLTIIFNWFYILFTCFCMGFAFFRFVEKYLHYSVKRLDSVWMAGLIIAAVYAQIFSLFGGVGMTANLILTAGCLEHVLR